MLQYSVVYSSVLQCAAVCCNMLQRVAVFGSALHAVTIHVYLGTVLCVALRCSVSRCAAEG